MALSSCLEGWVKGDSIKELPFFLRTWLDPKVPVRELMLPKWVAPNPPTKSTLKPKFGWVVVLMLPKWVAQNPSTETALKPKFDWVVGCNLLSSAVRRPLQKEQT